jgi:membrane protein DedA with SNARE-associated domain
MGLITHFLLSYGYLAVFLFVALESLGSPLPGEIVVIAAVLFAGSTHRLNIGLIALVAAVAAIAGDNGGYWLGQYGGSRLVRRYGHWVRLDARKLNVGRYLFVRHGGKIVFLGRLITSLRPYAAFFAGLNAMGRARFLAVDAAAAVAWAAACSFGTYALGSDTGGKRPQGRRLGGGRPADHRSNAGHVPDHAPIRRTRRGDLPGFATDSTR